VIGGNMPLFGLIAPNIDTLKKNRDTKGLLEALEYKKDKRIQFQAVQALRELKDTSTVPAMMMIYNKYSSDDIDLRYLLIESFAQIGNPIVIPVLIDALEDYIKRDTALEGIIQIGQPAIPYIAAALQDTTKRNSKRIRSGLIKALSKIGGDKAKEVILQAAQTESDMSEDTMEALAELKHKEVLPNLVSALSNSYTKDQRIRAAQSLGKLQNREAIPALEQALLEVNKNIQSQKRTMPDSPVDELETEIKAFVDVLSALNYNPKEDLAGLAYLHAKCHAEVEKLMSDMYHFCKDDSYLEYRANPKHNYRFISTDKFKKYELAKKELKNLHSTIAVLEIIDLLIVVFQNFIRNANELEVLERKTRKGDDSHLLRVKLSHCEDEFMEIFAAIGKPAEEALQNYLNNPTSRSEFREYFERALQEVRLLIMKSCA
jgi:hypothetical protein